MLLNYHIGWYRSWGPVCWTSAGSPDTTLAEPHPNSNTGGSLVHQMATYRCDDTRGCVMQFWPADDEHKCSKHVEAWNKTYCETKFCASSWLNTEIKSIHTIRTALYLSIRNTKQLTLFRSVSSIYRESNTRRNKYTTAHVQFLNFTRSFSIITGGPSKFKCCR